MRLITDHSIVNVCTMELVSIQLGQEIKIRRVMLQEFQVLTVAAAFFNENAVKYSASMLKKKERPTYRVNM